jgi:hypothetical protein
MKTELLKAHSVEEKYTLSVRSNLREGMQDYRGIRTPIGDSQLSVRPSSYADSAVLSLRRLTPCSNRTNVVAFSLVRVVRISLTRGAQG